MAGIPHRSPLALVRAKITAAVATSSPFSRHNPAPRQRGGVDWSLFVRSQIGEHPDEALERVTYDGKVFDKLGNIDLELEYLRALGEAGHIDFRLVNLSDAPLGAAAAYLLARINDVKPAILRYADHAWSDGQRTATLMPGSRRTRWGQSSTRWLPSRACPAQSSSIFPACRGISKGSVQQLVMNGIPVRARAQMTPEHAAQEDLCSFDAAILGAVLRQDHRGDRACRTCHRGPKVHAVPVQTAWDLGISANGMMAIWVFQVVASEIRVLDFISSYGRPLDFYVDWLEECYPRV